MGCRAAGAPASRNVPRLSAGHLTWITAATLLLATRLPAQTSKPASAAAAAKPAATLQLTLHAAVQLALHQNPEVQIGAIALAETEQDRKMARSNLLPQGTLEVNDSAIRGNIEANFGKPFPGIAQHIGPFQVFNAGGIFSMPIFNLSLWRNLKAADHAVTEASDSEMGVREQMTLLVVSQYLASLRAMANVHAARSRVHLARTLYDQARDLQTHGVSTGLDTLRANVELQNEQQNLIQAETQRKTAIYGLARLLNVNARTRIDLTDRLSFYQTPPFTAQQSIAVALTNRPEMKQLNARELRLEAERLSARDQKLPTLSFDGQYLQEGISAAAVIPTYIYEARIEWPLFTGGRIHAQEAKANLQLARLAQQRQDMANQIALEVKTAVADLEAAGHEVRVANLGVALAQEEVSQSRDRFQAGVADNIEVVSAQDALARAYDNQIGALYRYNEARAELARATGQMQDVYAK